MRKQKDLEKRLVDIYSGACGIAFDPETDLVDAEQLSRVVPAVMAIFEADDSSEGWKFLPWQLESFTDPATLAEFLYRCGVRA